MLKKRNKMSSDMRSVPDLLIVKLMMMMMTMMMVTLNNASDYRVTDYDRTISDGLMGKRTIGLSD